MSLVTSLLSDDPTPNPSTRQQRARQANRGEEQPGNQTPDSPPGTKPTNLTVPKNAENLSQKHYVLSYGAHYWHHKDTTAKITGLTGRPIHIGRAVTSISRSGVLGMYHSQREAENSGRSWLYEQLKVDDPDVDLPLPSQDNSRCEKKSWKESGWDRSGDGISTYSVGDTFRDVHLIALVTEVAQEEPENGVGRIGQEDRAVGEEKEDGREEVTHLTCDGQHVRERNPGTRKRDDTRREKKGSGGKIAEDQDDTGGWVQERMADKGKTKEAAEASDAASALVSMKGGKWSATL